MKRIFSLILVLGLLLQSKSFSAPSKVTGHNLLDNLVLCYVYFTAENDICERFGGKYVKVIDLKRKDPKLKIQTTNSTAEIVEEWSNTYFTILSQDNNNLKISVEYIPKNGTLRAQYNRDLVLINGLWLSKNFIEYNAQKVSKEMNPNIGKHNLKCKFVEELRYINNQYLKELYKLPDIYVKIDEKFNSMGLGYSIEYIKPSIKGLDGHNYIFFHKESGPVYHYFFDKFFTTLYRWTYDTDLKKNNLKLAGLTPDRILTLINLNFFPLIEKSYAQCERVVN